MGGKVNYYMLYYDEEKICKLNDLIIMLYRLQYIIFGVVSDLSTESH